jgi:short-subunit dehydrogenase
VTLVARSQSSILATKLSIQEVAPICILHIFTAEISNQESVGELFDFLKSEDGPGLPDVLINNAGSAEEINNIVNTDIEKWWFDSVGDFSSLHLETQLEKKLTGREH